MIRFSETVERKLGAYDPSMKDLIARHPPKVDSRPDGTLYHNGNLFVLTDVGEVITSQGTLYRLVYDVHHGQDGKKGEFRGRYQTDVIMGTLRGTKPGEFTFVRGFMNSSWLE